MSFGAQRTAAGQESGLIEAFYSLQYPDRDMLMVDGYSYKQHYDSNRTMRRWHCLRWQDQGCSAMFYTPFNYKDFGPELNYPRIERGEHNHPPPTFDVEVKPVELPGVQLLEGGRAVQIGPDTYTLDVGFYKEGYIKWKCFKPLCDGIVFTRTDHTVITDNINCHGCRWYPKLAEKAAKAAASGV